MSVIDRPAGPLLNPATPRGLELGPASLRGLSGQRLAVAVWSRRDTLLAVAGLASFAIVMQAFWWLTDSVVPWDSKNHFYPMFRFLADSLARGEIPLWNPYHFSGHPSVADPQSLLFTPSLFLLALIAPHASMATFDAWITLHLFVGALGMTALARCRGWQPSAALLTAIIYMLGGAAASRLQHTGMIVSYAYFPLALWSFDVLMERRGLGRAVLFGVLAGLMALGRDQVAFLFCAMLAGRLVFLTLRSGRIIDFLRERAGIIAVAALTGAAILIVPSLLTLQFLDASNRPGIPYGVAAAGSLAPVNFLTILAPNVFGSLDLSYDYWGPGYETMVEADWTDRAVNYLFFGTLPALLILWHGIAGGRLLARDMRFTLAVVVAAVLYALGRYTPVFGLVFDLVPGVSLYRRPADATFVLNIGFAFMSGYLLHRYIESGLPAPWRRLPRYAARGLIGTAVALPALVIGLGLAFSLRGGHGLAALEAIGCALIITAAGAALLIFGDLRRRRALAAAILVAATAGELIWRNAASSLNAEPAARYSVYDGMNPTESAGLAALRADMAKSGASEHPRVEILGLGGAWQNASMVLGLENTLGYNPLRISDYERAVGPGENAGDPNLRHFPGMFRGYKCRLASLLGLEYLVLDRPLVRLPRQFPKPQATQIFAGDHFYVYKLGHVAPRAYFATHVKSVDNETAIDAHELPDFDQAREALVDEDTMGKLSAGLRSAEAPTTASGAVTIAAMNDNSVRLEVVADRDGLVVLHDLYYPGWEASVDGIRTPVVKANILFRGVEVPAGSHVVEFKFRPFSASNLAAAASGLLHRGED
ncbi:MAG: hypothetical protein NVSMB26_20820 [Beijerinckiaceae bacterium]